LLFHLHRFRYNLPVSLARAPLARRCFVAQQCINGAGDIGIHNNFITPDQFDQHAKGWRRLAFQHGFLGAAAAGLFIAQRYRLDAADQIGKSRVQHQVRQRHPMGSANQLHTTFSNRSRCAGLRFGADLVDHHHFGHMIFDGLDHHCVLGMDIWYLHAAGAPNARVRHIAVAGDLVRGVYDYNPLARFIGQNARGFAQQGCFADAGAPKQQDAFAVHDQVVNDCQGALNRPANPTCQADNIALPVADRRDAVQGAGNAGPVIVAEIAEARRYIRQIGGSNLLVAQITLAIDKTGGGQPPQIEHDFE
jgi:hypothetical protein